MNETLSGNQYKTINNPQLYPEIGSPSVGPYISPTFNQNLSYNDQIFGTMVCYNCLSVLLIRHDWNYARCGECQKINKVPHRNTNQVPQNINTIYNNNVNNFYEDERDDDFLGDIPYVYGVVNCPFCTTENKIRKNAKRVTCYNCSNSFNVNGYSNNKRQTYVSKSLPKIIKYREFLPVYQNEQNCNCNNNMAQLFMLNKILEELKQKKKPVIAYPTLFSDPFGFYYRDLIGNNRYENDYEDIKVRRPLSISKPSIKNESESNGFRITIRKKNKDENGENKLSKSSVFEKVFFTNRLNDNKGDGS